MGEWERQVERERKGKEKKKKERIEKGREEGGKQARGVGVIMYLGGLSSAYGGSSLKCHLSQTRS